MFQKTKAVSRLVLAALVLKAGVGLLGCATSENETSSEAVSQEHTDRSVTALANAEGHPRPTAAGGSLLGHALASGDSAPSLSSARVGNGRARAAAKATKRFRPSRPTANSPRANRPGARVNAAETRRQRRARRRETARRVFAGAAVFAIAAAASANSANKARGSSRGASSSGGSSDDDTPAFIELGLPDPGSDLRGYNASTGEMTPYYDDWN